jgi:hypothetical protein
MERSRRLTEGLYVWTGALLSVHEVDSAYWQEWKLFGWPWDIQTFVIASLVLALPFMYGLVWLVRAPRIGARYALALSFLGVAAFGIHSWFLLQGRPEFRTPVSIGVLVAALFTSLALAWQSVRILKSPTQE